MCKERPTKRDRYLSFEARIAATIRQYFRAEEASDPVAAADEAHTICTYTGALLSMCLDDVDDWDSDTRWIDGLIDTEIHKLAHRHVSLCGDVVWGLSENPGGRQWKQAMFAEFLADDDGLKQSRICFVDSTAPEEEVAFGMYEAVSGVQHRAPDATLERRWQFVFENGARMAA